MQNGNGLNGTAKPQGAPVSINPVQAAQFALMFLARADFKANERDAYAIAEGLLNAIASGAAVVGPAAQPTPAVPENPTHEKGDA